jgi:hypothetical protein
MRAAAMKPILYQHTKHHQETMTDCFIKKEQIAMLLVQQEGPATRALGSRSSKRQRLSGGRRLESIGTESDAVSTFSWQHVFQTLTPEEEAFPNIGWDSDEESTVPEELTDKARREFEAAWGSLIGKKRPPASGGLLRSKSFRFDLAHQSPMDISNNATFPSFQLTPLEKSLYILSSVLPRSGSIRTVLAEPT